MKIDACNLSEMLKMLKSLTFIPLVVVLFFLANLESEAQCPSSELVSVNPPIPPSGSYEPGTVIELCFEITYVAGADWISAIVYDLPPGWDVSDFSANPPPPPPNCGGGAEWIWFDSNPCACALPVDGPGWYYDSGVTGPLDGDPCNDWGALCLSGTTDAFTYCIEIPLDADCGGPGNPADDEPLGPTIVLYGDQEVGSWSGGPCSNDPPCPAPNDTPDFPVTLNCCDAEAGVPPADPVNICGNTPFDLSTLLGPPVDADGTWTGPPGWTPPAPGNLSATFTPSTNPSLSDPPGDYTYSVTGSDGCVNTSTITMEFIDLGVQATNSLCAGTSLLSDLWLNPSIPLPPGGVWLFPDGTVVPGGLVDTDIANPSPSGIYDYTYVDGGGCYTTISMQLTISTGGPVGFPPNDITVCVLDDPFAPFDSLLGSPGSLGGNWIYNDAADQFLLFSNAGTATTWTLNPADYNNGGSGPMVDGYVVYFSTGDCGFNQDTIFIDVGDVFDAGEFTTTTICQGDGLTVLEDLLDGTPDSGGNWEDTSGNPVPNPFDPASVPVDVTYDFIYSGGFGGTGCFSSQLLQLTVVSDVIDAGDPTPAINICETAPPFNMTDTLNGSPQPGGTWTGPAGFTGGEFFVPGSSPEGLYTYTITTPCGTDFNTLNISITTTANAGINGPLNICPSDVNIPLIDGLGGTPQTGGTWTLGGTPVAPTVNGSAVTDGAVYQYSVGSGTCAATSEVTINLQAAPFAGVLTTTAQQYCATDPSFSLNTLFTTPPSATGDFWTDPSNAAVAGSTLNPATATSGTYTYTVTNGCGSDDVSIFISIEPAPNAGTSGPLQICENATAAVDLFGSLGAGVTTGGSWVGPGGPTTSIFNIGDPAGAYTYTVSSSPFGLCTSSATINVSYVTVADAGTDRSIVACENGITFFLFDSLGGTPDPGGTWNPFTAFTPGVTTPGTSTYEIINPGCPPSTASVTVSVQPAPNAGTNTSISLCQSLGTIDLTSYLNGSPLPGGTWTDLNTGAIVSSPFDISSSCGNTLQFEYTVVAGDCENSSTLQIAVECPPDAGPDVASEFCGAGGVIVLSSLIDPTADQPGVFTNSSGTVVTTIPQTSASSGTYIYTVSGTQCSDDQAIYDLTIIDPINVTVVSAECNLAQTGYTVILEITGGDGNYTVSGLPGTINTTVTPAVFMSSLITAGTTYSYVVSDTGPCPDVSAGPINSPNCSCPADANFVETSIAICEGNTANIELNFNSGAAPFTIDYTDGTNTFTNVGPFNSGDFLQVTPATTTQYTLTGVSDQNCSTTVNDVINVVVEPAPNAGPDVSSDLCGTGGIIVLSSLIDPSADQTGVFTNASGTVVTNIPQTSAGSGTYTYTVSGTQCPDDQASYTLSISDQINVNVVSAICNAAQTGYTVTLEISGGDGNYTVSGLPGTINTTVTPAVFMSSLITAGTTYSYVVSDTGPCPDVSAGPINSPNCSCPADANFVETSIAICEGSTANIELNFNSGAAPFTIDYTDGTNTFTNVGPFNSGDVLQVTPATTTQYTLTGVSDANCNTTATDVINVVVEPAPNAGPDVNETFCATNAPYNLVNLVDGSTGSTTGNFFNSAGNAVPGNTINLTSSASDVYTYEVTGTQCPADEATYIVTINDQISISNILVECNSAQTGYTVSFDIEGGDGNYSVVAGGAYDGTLTPGAVDSYESALIPNDTDYSFTISDGSPCSDQFVSGLDPDCDCPASAALTGTTSICDGDCATLTFNLQGDGPWDVVYENSLDAANPELLEGIGNGHQVTVCPSSTATFTIISVNDFNCSGPVNGQPVTVTVDSPLEISDITETCDDISENYTVGFTVSGGIPGTYQVNPFGQSFVGGNYQSLPVPSGDPYSFTVSDAGACPDLLVEGVEECACITAAGSIVPGLIETCENESLVIPFNEDDVLDGNDGYQFILHDGNETEIGDIVARFNNATIPVPEEIIFGQTYYITGLAGNTDIFGDVILTGECTAETNGIPVVFHALPSAAISGSGAVCPGEEAELLVSLTGEGPWVFEYALDAVPQPSVSTADNEYIFTTTTTGNYTLLSVTDQNCEGSVSGLVQVSNFNTPTAVLSGDGNVCENSGDGPVVNLTGQAPWTFFYSIDGEESAEPITSFSNEFTIPAQVDGNYTLSSLNDANCAGTVSGSLDVTILPLPTAAISGGGSVCEGDELPFQVTLTGDGPWSVIYSVDGIPQPSITSDVSVYTFSSDIDGEYDITQVTDQNCSGEAFESDASLTVNPLPTANVLSNQDEICIGEELELIYDLQGTPPFTLTYILDSDTVTLTGLTTDFVEILEPTVPVFTEVLYVEDSSIPVCSNTPNITKFIPVAELPDMPVLEDVDICADTDSVSIGANGVPELEYTWSPEDRLSDPKAANPTFTLDEDDFSPVVKKYTYVLTASNGDCFADDTLTVTVDPGPRARFSFSPNPVNSEDTKVRFLNQSSTDEDAVYFWQFDSLDTSQEYNPVFEFPGGQIADYTVLLTVIDPMTGCMDEWSDILEIKPEMLVYVPTAFTPDGDGLNDLWRPVLSNIDENDYKLTVFDRFGIIVFESNDPTKAWNGSMNGDDFFVKTGVYVWQIETKNPISLEDVDFKGSVTVIR